MTETTKLAKRNPNQKKHVSKAFSCPANSSVVVSMAIPDISGYSYFSTGSFNTGGLRLVPETITGNGSTVSMTLFNTSAAKIDGTAEIDVLYTLNA